MRKIPSIDVEAIRAKLARRRNQTPKERREDNKRLKEERDRAPKVSWGKTVECALIICGGCGARLTSEASMDKHRDAVGHHRFYIALEEL